MDIVKTGEPILLHVCCGPCAIHPHRALIAEGYAPTAFFYNPNIQPSREYRRRLETLQTYASEEALPVLEREGYHPGEHLSLTLDSRDERPARCRACYGLRLGETAREAVARGFGLFSTTLLVSPRQSHEEVRYAGERAAAATSGRARFLYRDFRPGYQEAVAISREKGLYRQPYCGCLWSEMERYERSRR